MWRWWDLLNCLTVNFHEHAYPRDEVHGFIVDASSSFYAEFGEAITERVDRWLDEVHASLDLDPDDDEGE